MPRVVVITEKPGERAAVLLDEQVSSIHLDSEHSAWQFIERLGWAISDAEESERTPSSAAVPAPARVRTRIEHAERLLGARGGYARRRSASLAS